MKILFATAALAAVTTSAQAQEANWDRWFVGFDAGYIWRTSTSEYDGRLNSEGPRAAVTVGRWWLFDAMAVGVDGSFGVGGARIEYRDEFSGLPIGWEGSEADSFSVSTRAKLGTTLGPALIYAAAGPQYVHTRNRFRWLPGDWSTGSMSKLEDC